MSFSNLIWDNTPTIPRSGWESELTKRLCPRYIVSNFKMFDVFIPNDT